MRNNLLLICDLDNTLYDWIGYFVPSFYAMVDAAVDIMSCDRERLLDDFRSVHQMHHDSEQPFALLETRTVKEHYRDVPISSVVKILDPAFHAFNAARNRNLRLHDGVLDSLHLMRSRGVTLIAHTESKLYGALDRLHRLGLSEFFTKIYCRERSTLAHPDTNHGSRWLSRFPLDKVRELSQHRSKPNPQVLSEICASERVPVDDAAYVGDSVARDILMAKRAGLFAIWAAYGAKHDASLYAALVRVSHWTPEEVAKEQQLRQEAASVKPDFVAETSFREVPAALGFYGLEDQTHQAL
jgi:FMN phosphatase YigB (HAD superfamily)